MTSWSSFTPPLILGHDVAGVVVRVGSRVRRFKPGDEVYARPADESVPAGVEFAYRELGTSNPGVPVVFLGHLTAVADAAVR